MFCTHLDADFVYSDDNRALHTMSTVRSQIKIISEILGQNFFN